MHTTLLLLTTALVASTLAAADSATVVLQSGTGASATNTTITIPLNSIYTSTNTLTSSISTLYITDASGVPLDSLICTPFAKTDGSSPAGKFFTSSKPTELDASAVLKSIVCISKAILNAPPGGVAGTTTAAAGQTGGSGSSTRAATATGASATPQSTGNAATSLYLPGELFGGLALAGFGLAFAL